MIARKLSSTFYFRADKDDYVVWWTFQSESNIYISLVSAIDVNIGTLAMHMLLPIAMPMQYQFDFIVRLIECIIFYPN